MLIFLIHSSQFRILWKSVIIFSIVVTVFLGKIFSPVSCQKRLYEYLNSPRDTKLQSSQVLAFCNLFQIPIFQEKKKKSWIVSILDLWPSELGLCVLSLCWEELNNFSYGGWVYMRGKQEEIKKRKWCFCSSERMC